MENLYGQWGLVVIVIAGDFNTDPTDAQFVHEKTFDIFREAGFSWAWENTPKEERITHPGNGRYPPATFDGFLLKGAKQISCEVLPVTLPVSDHNPVLLKILVPE